MFWSKKDKEIAKLRAQLDYQTTILFGLANERRKEMRSEFNATQVIVIDLSTKKIETEQLKGAA